MKKYCFFAELKLNVEFTDEEFEIIFNDASNHYDSTVKATAFPGYGGFLHGMKNRRNWEKESGNSPDYAYEWDLSYKDLNLILKAIEFDENDDAKILYYKLRKIVEEMQNANVEINKTLKKNDIN
ncbi:hypothetical protein M0Q97_10830 [Candidatus Dojkabacteria bacterium]|jgi:hypothetical protein|nr:hypothetical protein [Candidatus Dojkabacteria bacterium]